MTITIDPLLSRLCQAHPAKMPPDFGNRVMAAIEASRERQKKLDTLIAEAEAEMEKRERLAELGKKLKREDEAEFALRTIRNAVCTAYGVSPRDFNSDRRTANLVRPRQVAYYLAKEFSHFSFPVIGRHFGNRDHTTALYGYRKIARLRQTDKKLDREICSLIATLSQKEAA
jgi:chromosomal replication initiator protein